MPEVSAEAQAEAKPAGPPDLPPAACAAALAHHFPALFGAGRALPIKLRIQTDIQQRVPGVFSRKSLSIFLHRHTTSTPYIKALLNSPHRFDLDGQPAGEVAEEHRAAATEELARRQAIVQARRAAERDAQRLAQRQAQADMRAAAPGAPDGAPTAEAAPVGPRPERPPRPGQARPDARRPQRPQRPAQGRPPQRPAQDRPARPPAPQQPHNARPEPASEPVAEQAAVALTPEQAADNEARRSRATLLRTYETTTLTRANFCALKGMAEPALEALLVQARAEREQRPREPRPEHWPDHRPGRPR